MCTSDFFSEDGMIGLLSQAVELFKEVYTNVSQYLISDQIS